MSSSVVGFSTSKKLLVGADIPLDSDRYPLKQLLSAFREAARRKSEMRLLLTGRRSSNERFPVWNYIDKHGLTDSVEYLPYFDQCRDFPIKKSDCDAWLSKSALTPDITATHLLQMAQGALTRPRKLALFVTSFHPGKMEGNSALMRQWLDYLRAAGYRIHVLYYSIDAHTYDRDEFPDYGQKFERFVHVTPTSGLVNVNRNGLNVHVDDWAGIELLDGVSSLTAEFEYDVAIVNYAFMSAAFERVPAYTRRILVTHDSFADRNRRMLAQGYPESGWMSLDERGELLACRRADTIIALQDDEANYFQRLAGPRADVRIVGPIPAAETVTPPASAPRLRVGYFGSSNHVNEYNIVAYMKEWASNSTLMQRAELILAGGASRTVGRFAPEGLLEAVKPTCLGAVEQLSDFFGMCDVLINPERGGTGIKIKTLEAMAHGCATLTTSAGSVGIGSASRFHNARDFAALARLTADLAAAQPLVEEARKETRATFAAYVVRHKAAMETLLGPVRQQSSRPLLRDGRMQMAIPPYVQKTASGYQLDEFRKFFERVDVRGKRVLEIGSDFHLATARLFAANGAEQVVATNIGDWRSPEPLPPNVQFRVGDVADVELPEEGFDIVYGIAVLEHIPDMERVALAIKRALRRGGIAYLQGCPMWTGAIGHHVWVDAGQIATTEGSPLPAGAASGDVVYSFADPAKNPIPDWAHLTHTPDALSALLVDKGLPQSHADSVVRYIYNQDGAMTGSCSNFIPPSDILKVLEDHFAVEVQPITHALPDSAEFRKAREKYSEFDLQTLGLELWLAHSAEDLPGSRADLPTISIIIPFYNVEDYLEDCLRSILQQDFQDFEIILVDDASPDGSRIVAERMAAEDKRIRVITHSANAGLGLARNTGVRNARGQFLFFLDSDDLLAGPSALRILLDDARTSGCHVVVGSCKRLLLDGTIAEFDTVFERGRGRPENDAMDGLEAFRAGMGLHGAPYLPLRAWGTLIDRSYYDSLNLEFPAGEHEDLAHTPFLYFNSNGVYYERSVVVHYRDRTGSLSNTPWSKGKIQRYGDLWRELARRIERYGLWHQYADVGNHHAAHLLWRIDTNGLEQGAEDAAITVLKDILQDLRKSESHTSLVSLLNMVRQSNWLRQGDDATYRSVLACFPPSVLLEYHRSRLGVEARAVPWSSAPAPRPAATAQAPAPFGSAMPAIPAVTDRAAALARNEARVAEIFAEYHQAASDRLKSFPAMLTEGDRALYFHAGRHFTFQGAIVDGGCFVGGTTTGLVEGLRNNPAFAQQQGTKGLIRVYDLFEIDDDYVLHHLQKNYPERDFTGQTSFLPVFKDNMKADAELLDIRPGDVTAIGYPDQAPIELFGVDFCKALVVTDHAVRAFFPRLMLGALVLQQDFIHEFHPHIHLSMLRLHDHFDTEVELKWGGSFAYRCVKAITPEVIQQRFGKDSSWFYEAETNIALLRRLIDDTLYDENRWILILTLGIYYHAIGRQAEARATYQEACVRFPQFEPSDVTRKLIGE